MLSINIVDKNNEVILRNCTVIKQTLNYCIVLSENKQAVLISKEFYPEAKKEFHDSFMVRSLKSNLFYDDFMDVLNSAIEIVSFFVECGAISQRREREEGGIVSENLNGEFICLPKAGLDPDLESKIRDFNNSKNIKIDLMRG